MNRSLPNPPTPRGSSSPSAGWCYGAKDFRERVLDFADADIRKLSRSVFGQSNYLGEDARDHGEREAVAILKAGLKVFGLTPEKLKTARKGALEKAVIAAEIRERTSMPLAWITGKLKMGTTANVRRACAKVGSPQGLPREIKKARKAFINEIPSWYH